jgi:TonB family protein
MGEFQDHYVLERVAVRAAKQWRFEPGMFKGQPAPVTVTIEMSFTLRN